MRKPKELEPDRLVFPGYSGRKPDVPEPDRLIHPGFAAKKPDGSQADPMMFPDYTGRREEDAQEQLEPTRRISIRSRRLLVVCGLLVVAIVSFFPIQALSNRSLRRSALALARASAEKGEFDLAIRNLESYLESWPDDLDALEVAYRIRADAARSYEDISEAAKLASQLIRLDPYGKDRQETRRRLVRLWVLQSELVREYADKMDHNESLVYENRYRAARSIAHELTYGVKVDGKVVIPGVDTSQSHRLLAQTLDALVLSDHEKYKEYQDEAIREFAEALRLDRGDVVSAERLVRHELEKKKDPVAARKLMDDLLEANPGSTEVRLARHRYYTSIKKFDAATAEMAAAVALAPDSAEVRLLAAQDAFRRHNLAEVQAHCDAIPASAREVPKLRMLLGMLEFARGDNEKAIEHYRIGLAMTEGLDRDLTFALAHSLIKLNRLAEARPLIAQFQRLGGDDRNGVGRFLNALYDQQAGHYARAIAGLKKAEPRISESLKAELQLALARCHQSLGELSLAKYAYQKAIALSPWAPEPRREIARLLLATNPQEAVAEMERALAQSPNDLSAILDAGRLHLARQKALPAPDRRWRRLEEILDQADKVAPGDFGFRMLRAEYLIAVGDPERAIDLLSRSANGPERKNLDAWIFLAGQLEELGRRDEALRVLEEAATADAAGDGVRLRIARAAMLARAGKGQQARDLLTGDRGPIPGGEQPELTRALGDLAREMGDRETARAAYLEWARLAPDSTDPGLALMGLGELFGDQEATRLGIESLRSIGGDREPYGLAALAMELLRADPARPGPPSDEKLAKAERILAQLHEIAPQFMVGHLIRGKVLVSRGKLAEAAAEFRQALEDGGSTQALVGLVGVLWKMRKFDELVLLQKKYEYQAMQGGSKDALVGFYRIALKVALKEGHNERARYFASKIVEKLPDSIEARANLARVLESLGDVGQAEATYRDLVDRHPNDASAWAALATFQSLHGRPEDLARTIEEARKRYKGERIELVMGRCHWLARDIPAASADYAAALKKAPDDSGTLREVADFYRAQGRSEDLEMVLRRASKLKHPWASQSLALQLSSSKDPSAWSESWSLVEPGSGTSSESPEERLLRATVLSRSPDPARRGQAFSIMVALTKDLPASNPVAVEARVRLAMALLESNRPAEAETFIAPVAGDPSRPNPMALAIWVEALARSGKAEEASARLDRLIAVEPRSPRAATSRAWVLQARGYQAEAMAVLDEAVELASASGDGEAVAVALAGVAQKIGRDDDPEGLLAKVAARWPRDAYLLALFQAGRKRYAEALASARIALEAGSVDEAIQVARELMVLQRADREFLKKIDALGDSARSKSPRSIEVLLIQADLHHLQGRYEEEVAVYREAAGLNPGSFSFLNNMAWTLSEGLGKHDEALARIDEAIRRIGRTPDLLDTRGVILARLGRLDEAIADLEQCAKTNASPTTYLHLARAYLKAGKAEDFRRCRELVRKAKLDPADLDPTDRAGLEEILTRSP